MGYIPRGHETHETHICGLTEKNIGRSELCLCTRVASLALSRKQCRRAVVMFMDSAFPVQKRAMFTYLSRVGMCLSSGRHTRPSSFLRNESRKRGSLRLPSPFPPSSLYHITPEATRGVYVHKMYIERTSLSHHLQLSTQAEHQPNLYPSPCFVLSIPTHATRWSSWQLSGCKKKKRSIKKASRHLSPIALKRYLSLA